MRAEEAMLLDPGALPPHEFLWYLLLMPIFGYVCALMAQSRGRRKWLWFALGFFFTVIAAIALASLSRLDHDTHGEKP
jgi:bacteriorhodopsin